MAKKKAKKLVTRNKDGSYTDGMVKWGGRPRLVTKEEINRLEAEAELSSARLAGIRLIQIAEELRALIKPYNVDAQSKAELERQRSDPRYQRAQLDSQLPDGVLAALIAMEDCEKLARSLFVIEKRVESCNADEKRLILEYGPDYGSLVLRALRIGRITMQAEMRLKYAVSVLAAQESDEARRRGGRATKKVLSSDEELLFDIACANNKDKKPKYKLIAEEMTNRHGFKMSESAVKRRIKERQRKGSSN